jgi:hypothetical protein
MPSISYQYNNLEFTRKNIEPVSREEYDLMKEDFSDFVDEYIDAIKTKYKKLGNPNAFKWKLFLILLTAALVLTGFNLGLKAYGKEDAGEIFAMLSAFPYFAIVIQPIQWAAAQLKGYSVVRGFEIDAKTYFSLHHDIICVTENYEDYLAGLKRYYNKK